MDTIVLRIDQPQPGGNYLAVLAGAQGNELGRVEFPTDLAPPAMPNPLTAAQISEIFAADPSENDDLPRIGAQLYSLIGQGPIHGELDPDGAPRRLLLDVEPAALRGLPWELMVRDGVPLANSASRPICRGSLSSPALAASEWPLRVLIVDGGEGVGENIVQAAEEITQIIQMINVSVDDEKGPHRADVDLLVLTRPARRQILEAFEDPADAERFQPHQGFKPHILHFIGHGDIAVGGQSFLQLYGEAGDAPVDWFADDIRTDFLVTHRPRLVILNACKTAGAAANGLWSVTDAFLQARVPAAIGLRANVSGEHARVFSGALYQALAQGKALDEAMTQARRALWKGVQNPSKRLEWAAPTLEVRTDPATVITVGGDIDSQVRQQVQQSSDLSKVRSLVDRRPECSGAWRRVAEDQRKVVVVRGNPGVGKTAFAHLLMERCALRRHQIRYIDLKGIQKIDVLTVLRRICDGAGTAADALALTGPLPVAAFQPFKDTVQTLLGAPLSEASNWSSVQEAIDRKRIAEDFQKGLEQAIVAPPLVLVFDHLQEVHEDQMRSFLVPDILSWCARRSNRDLLLVWLVNTNDYERFEMEKVRTNFRLIDIEGFSARQWKELAWEFVWRNLTPPPSPGADPIQTLDQQISLFGQAFNDRWQPTQLDLLRLVAERTFGWSSR